jgi:murein DD-endopeptidase MepM/ murein hydrolase activator NlpD
MNWRRSIIRALPLVPLALMVFVQVSATQAMADHPYPESITWPVDPPTVVEHFAAPATPWGRGHRGIDFLAAPGQSVYAIGPGRIVYVGVIAGKPVIAIEHPSGLRSSYEPVHASLSEGMLVQPGDVIGMVAAAGGHCAKRCLHLGLRAWGRYVDPMLLLRSRAVLLPLGTVR